MTVIGHGIDLVDINRIARMLAAHGDRFTARCFTEVERRYADGAGRNRAERYAARFACKEAILKALGTGWTGGISWTEMELRNEVSGRPSIALSGRCAEVAAGLGITDWHVSLSHTGHFAVASVIGTG